MTNIPLDVQIGIIGNKIEAWHNTEYDARLDAEIGTEIGNDRMVKEGTERIKQARKAVTILERKLAELKEKREPRQEEEHTTGGEDDGEPTD